MNLTSLVNGTWKMLMQWDQLQGDKLMLRQLGVQFTEAVSCIYPQDMNNNPKMLALATLVGDRAYLSEFSFAFQNKLINLYF